MESACFLTAALKWKRRLPQHVRPGVAWRNAAEIFIGRKNASTEIRDVPDITKSAGRVKFGDFAGVSPNFGRLVFGGALSPFSVVSKSIFASRQNIHG